MKKSSEEQLLEALSLAEEIAINERRSESDTEFTAKEGRKRLKRLLKKTAGDPLVISLLPQARLITLQGEERQAAIENTLLGKLGTIIASHAPLKELEEGEITNLVLKDSPEDELLEKFNQQLREGNLGACLASLAVLLDVAVLDLRDTDLPPKAPNYTYPNTPPRKTPIYIH